MIYLEKSEALKGNESSQLEKQVEAFNGTIPVSGIIKLVLSGAAVIGRLVQLGRDRQFTVETIEREGRIVWHLGKEVKEMVQKVKDAVKADPAKKAARQSKRSEKKTVKATKRAAKAVKQAAKRASRR